MTLFCSVQPHDPIKKQSWRTAMALEQKKIWEIVRSAKNQDFDMPEFQRPFVWEPEKVMSLLESLYLDYPVGTFLIWDSSTYVESKTVRGQNPGNWIVDGQQRTTALALAFGDKPYWWPDNADWNDKLQKYDVAVKIGAGEEERLEFGLYTKEKRADPSCVSVRKILSRQRIEDLSELTERLCKEIFPETSNILSIFSKINAKIASVWAIRDRQIPIITINHEAEDVAEIFARLNGQGTQLKEADIILAIAAVNNAGWVREKYLPFQEELIERGWDFEAGIFIRTMTGIGEGRARLKEVQKSFWSPPNFMGVWQRVHGTISAVCLRLAQYGIAGTDLISSKNSLIPLFVAHSRWETDPAYKFSQLFRWFLMANKDGRYAGASTTYLDEDIQALFKATNFPKALEAMYKPLTAATITPENLTARFDRATARQFFRLMLYLVLRSKHAVDWVEKTQIGFDKTGASIASDFKPNWHHIFPKSVLRNYNIEDDPINWFSNITVLNEKTNVKKLQAKAPAKYITDFNISADMLEQHSIPKSFIPPYDKFDGEITKAWSLDRFDEFVLERADVLAQEMNSYLDELG
jgi:hypothetical protein